MHGDLGIRVEISWIELMSSCENIMLHNSVLFATCFGIASVSSS